AEIDVVAPTRIDGRTLFEYGGFRFTLFPRQGGYAPEVDMADTLFRIGRNIGRMHQLAQSQPFAHRRALSLEVWAHESREFLLSQGFIPDGLREAYDSLSRDLILRMEKIWSSRDWHFIRLHGDCHLGNILWRDDRGVFVDFDDCVMGPAVQDIWLLLSGDRPQQISQLQEIIEGYEEFCEFDNSQFALIETLRTLRMMYYAAWLARRWDDPAFPMHFPWFNTERYWSSHVLELREQLAALDEEPLRLTPW
ncbi:MAG: serine/threonine protein kinase, partial [Oleiphilaceae bacterium]|nr:serine/threonine protein kinase [Oleiphilaceae bacterium]